MHRLEYIAFKDRIKNILETFQLEGEKRCCLEEKDKEKG